MKRLLFLLPSQRWALCLLGLLLFFNFISPHRPPGRIGLMPDKPRVNLPKSKASLPRKQLVRASSATDPIRFTIRTTKSSILVGEQVDIIVKAQLLNLSPNLMFFTPGSNGYTLKLLLPDDFQLTSSDLPEFITDELTYPSRTEVIYHVQGYFTSATEGSCFRLLRGPKQSNGSSLFEEKTRLCINLNPQQSKSGRLAVENSLEKGNPRLTVLAPSLSSGSQANLTSTCTPFAEVCSGNQYEVRNQTISVPSNDSYVLSFRYKAPEKLVNAIVRVDGTELATVASAQTGSYQTQTVATLTLTAGTHTIGLSSGTSGGYICFDKLCLDPSSGCSPPAAPSISATGGSQVCNGSSVNLTASGCSGQVNWSNGAAGNSININSAGTYSATCSDGGCTSSASNAITITSCVPNELTGRYNYSSNGAQSLLTIQAATNEGVQLKFERQDGTSFTTTNPDGVQIVSGTYYSPATLANAPDAFTRQWQLYSGTVPLKLTFKRDSNGETSVYQFTPANGAYQHPLDNSDQCGFTLTAPNNANVSCGASVNLAGSCTGDCNGVTYSWSGTGLNATGLTATFNAPATNGTYTYTLTASGASCSRTASTVLTVSGCSTTPGVYSYRGDTFDYTPLAPTSTADVFPVFENDKIKVKLALRNQILTSQEPGMGGAVYQIFNKQHNTTHTLVYNPNRYNGDDNAVVDRSGPPNRIFLGQGLSDCEYASPTPFYTNESDGAAGSSYPINGINPGGTDGGLGFNPNEGGDDLMNSGQLQTYGRNGNSFYVKTKPPIYGQNRYFPPNDQVIFEKWGTLNDRALVLNYQSNWNRTNPKDMGRHVSKGQEVPCLYVNGLRVFKWYDGTNPYGNDGATTITAPLSENNRNGVGMNGGREGAVHLSEPLIWVGGTDGYGIGLIIKDNIKAAYGFWGDGGFDAANPSMGGSYASITASPQEIIDNKLIWRHRAEVVVGTYEECRNYMYTISYRPEFTPKFKFNVPGRHGWYLNSGDNDDRHTWDDTFDGNNRQGWKVYFGAGKDAAIKSPGVIWKASQIDTIYIRYKYVGNQPQWMLNFARNRQKADGGIDQSSRFASEESIRYSNGPANVPAQNIFFNVIGDGEWHTAKVSVRGSSAWQGVINQISLYPHPYSDGRSYNAGEYCIIDWINSENAEPNP